MSILQKHAQGSLSAVCRFLGLETPDMSYSTLNEKFGVGTDLVIPPDQYEKGQYWAIGNGGSYATYYPADGTSDQQSYPHNTSHSGLFNHMPFIIRPVGSDLSAIERNKYRGRVLKTYNGQQYWAYFLMPINTVGVVPSFEKRTSVAGSTPTAFNHVASDLSPTLPVISGGGSMVATGEYIAAVATLTFAMTKEQRDEYINAVNIIYNGNISRGVIFELAIVSGADAANTVGGVTYTEAAKARIASSMATSLPMHILTEGVSVGIKVESISALMALVANP